MKLKQNENVFAFNRLAYLLSREMQDKGAAFYQKFSSNISHYP